MNVTPPGGDYPYGDIKNNTGSNNGTPVDRNVYGDIHQFFAKMFAESGLTANNQLDNEANGFQLFEALLAAIKHPEWEVGNYTKMFDTLSVDGATILDSNCNITLNGRSVQYQLSLQLDVTDATDINQATDISFEMSGQLKAKYKAIASTQDLADVGVSILQAGASNFGASTLFTNNADCVIRVLITDRNVVNGNTILILISGCYPAF